MASLPAIPEGKWTNLPEEQRNQLLGMYQEGLDGLLEEFQRAKDEVFRARCMTVHDPS